MRLDPVDYPFVHEVAADLPRHDDREQFLAGIDLILAGMGKCYISAIRFGRKFAGRKAEINDGDRL